MRKAKRTRSTYSPDQLEQLHKRFKTDTHLPLQERCIIGANIGISEHQVKVWFQNRRNKLKKLAKEGRTEEPVRRRKTPKPKMTKTKPVKLENTPLLQYPSTFPYHETHPYVPNQLPTLSTPIGQDNYYQNAAKFNYAAPTYPVYPYHFHYPSLPVTPPMSPEPVEAQQDMLLHPKQEPISPTLQPRGGLIQQNDNVPQYTWYSL